MKKNLKNMAYLSITFLILLVSIAGTATAATLYVGPNGAGYTKIQDSVNAANFGDIIIVKPGTYVENVDVNKMVTIVSESGNPEDTIVRAANSNDHVFDIKYNYVTIEGLGIDGATGSGKAGIFLGNYIDDCKINNNVLKNNTNGIETYNSHRSLLENNTVTESISAGILLRNPNGPL